MKESCKDRERGRASEVLMDSNQVIGGYLVGYCHCKSRGSPDQVLFGFLRGRMSLTPLELLSPIISCGSMTLDVIIFFYNSKKRTGCFSKPPSLRVHHIFKCLCHKQPVVKFQLVFQTQHQNLPSENTQNFEEELYQMIQFALTRCSEQYCRKLLVSVQCLCVLLHVLYL